MFHKQPNQDLNILNLNYKCRDQHFSIQFSQVDSSNREKENTISIQDEYKQNL